jgi:tRNA G18 (ribose-2'-O)-methylase SpoU
MGPVLTHFISSRQNTDSCFARLPGELLTRRAIIEGPLFVLAEAERRECAVREVYVSRRPDPDLIRHLQRVVRDGIPITETSVAELDSIAGSTRHDGVVATVAGGHHCRYGTEKRLWLIFRLALTRSARSPERL